MRTLAAATSAPAAAPAPSDGHWRESAEAVALPVLALAGALLAFGVFVWLSGRDPVEAWVLLFKGAFGDSFSWQNTLQRAAPLMLTALAVALPAQAGLTVIGGEGALVLGALACAALPMLVPSLAGWPGTGLMLLAGALAGAGWVALAGWLRQARGVNETISSLLLGYLAIALFKHVVEGPLRDPASLNKPSTPPVAESVRIGGLPWDGAVTDVHWGLAWGVLLCLAAGVWLTFTASGFALRVVGGNVRAARLVGLPTLGLILAGCALGGAAAGLAGAIEVLAVHTSANASLIAGLGYTGILVSFVARHNPWAIPPVAILFGGFGAAGSLLQRRMDLPDASVLVLQGFAFVLILAAEAGRGRLFGGSGRGR
ncbi:ABC transporter permease [Sphaerotilus montanus]|uniref:Simple sugar transport system permease protein n=1 Tax=Sphaerotilus montanus TaxID=522889 RepID=A0A7Y9R2Y3_9BURK|nr:ABC transporter permease [Sphaerotilus montanus]NYG34629.1 simple sugar transport system permease protein [Sphaerotilus montanus]NZD58987.1 ABC transporter permease [Sphaerotilus montanus]